MSFYTPPRPHQERAAGAARSMIARGLASLSDEQAAEAIAHILTLERGADRAVKISDMASRAAWIEGRDAG